MNQDRPDTDEISAEEAENRHYVGLPLEERTWTRSHDTQLARNHDAQEAKMAEVREATQVGGFPSKEAQRLWAELLQLEHDESVLHVDAGIWNPSILRPKSAL